MKPDEKNTRTSTDTYYTIAYEHTLYGDTKPTIQHAVYFTLKAAQEAMMKMIKRGQTVISMEEQTMKETPQILQILRKDTPQ